MYICIVHRIELAGRIRWIWSVFEEGWRYPSFFRAFCAVAILVSCLEKAGFYPFSGQYF